MLSKQVKIRIASNKYFHRIPKWQRYMYEHFRRQIAMAQRQYDTAKHMLEPEGATFRALFLSRRDALELQSRTWTRADWRKHEEQQRLLMKQIQQANRQTFGRLGKPIDLYGDSDNYKKFPDEVLKDIRRLEDHPYAKPLVEATDEFFAQVSQVVKKATPIDENTSVFGVKSIELNQAPKKQGE